MKLINYYNLTIRQHDLFLHFLKECHTETDQPAHINMYDDNWEYKNNTLLYILEKTDRFKYNGQYNILFHNNEIIACSGIYTSNFCSDIALSGTRTWIKKQYRNKLISREILLPNEKKYAKFKGFKAIALCFNEYNKHIINIFYRKRLGENRSNKLPHHLFYNNLNKVNFAVEIQSTKQYVLYEKLDDTFYFDWEIIKYQ